MCSASGIFANGTYGAGWNVTDRDGEQAEAGQGVTGIFGGDFDASASASSAPRPSVSLVIWTVIFGIAFAFFKIQNALTKGGIRSEEADEIAGLDLPEMGALAYPEFEFAIEHVGSGDRRAARSSAPPVAAIHQGEPDLIRPIR